jgi:hypothetical protein
MFFCTKYCAILHESLNLQVLQFAIFVRLDVPVVGAEHIDAPMVSSRSCDGILRRNSNGPQTSKSVWRTPLVWARMMGAGDIDPTLREGVAAFPPRTVVIHAGTGASRFGTIAKYKPQNDKTPSRDGVLQADGESSC